MWQNTMHGASLRDKLTYWVPVMVIMLSIIGMLFRSFWRFHQKKTHQRLLQYEYYEANYNIHRPRIGDVHCFSHSSKISDLTMSLTSDDLYGWSRSPRGKYKYTRTVSNPGQDTYGNLLGALQEESVVQNGGYDNHAYYDELPRVKPRSKPRYHTDDDEYVGISRNIINSYYEDVGLPVPPSKPVKRRSDQNHKSKKTGFGAFYTLDHSDNENNHLELTNRRMSEIIRSPRRLPQLEDSYWKSVDPEVVVSMYGSNSTLSVNPEESRSLSHQYEYELIQEQQRYIKRKKRLRRKFGKVVKDVMEEEQNAKRPTHNSEGIAEFRPKHHRRKHRKHDISIKQNQRVFWLSSADVPQTTV